MTMQKEAVFKRISLVAIMLVLFIIMIPHPVHAGSMSISEKEIVIAKGETTKLKINNCGKRKVTWISNRPSVATVSKSGKIAAKNPGTAIITAKAGKTAFRCTVRVVMGALDYSDMDLHFIENGKEGIVNIISSDYGFYYCMQTIENNSGSGGNKKSFTSRKIATGDKYNKVKRAYGKSVIKRFNYTDDKVYKYIKAGSEVTTTHTDDSRTVIKTGGIIPTYEKVIKYYCEYKYTRNYDNYYIRFYLDSSKKVAGYVLLNEYYH